MPSSEQLVGRTWECKHWRFPLNYFHALTILHSAKQVGEVSREHWDSGRDAIGFVLNGLTADGAFEYVMRTLDLDLQ